jgi:hypothetical protein
VAPLQQTAVAPLARRYCSSTATTEVLQQCSYYSSAAFGRGCAVSSRQPAVVASLDRRCCGSVIRRAAVAVSLTGAVVTPTTAAAAGALVGGACTSRGLTRHTWSEAPRLVQSMRCAGNRGSVGCAVYTRQPAVGQPADSCTGQPLLH